MANFEIRRGADAIEGRKAMNIEVGDVVELNNGEVHKVDRMLGGDPDHVNAHGHGPFVIDEVRYHKDGRFGCQGFEHHLSVMCVIARASDDTPKLWRDMTDGEKGALLLADHKGAAIHVWEPIAEAWRPLDFGEFMFQDDRAYRVEPAATREPIKIQGPSGEILGSGTMLRRDGEWDFDSISARFRTFWGANRAGVRRRTFWSPESGRWSSCHDPGLCPNPNVRKRGRRGSPHLSPCVPTRALEPDQQSGW